ncbi:hypothetical protein [Streptomyces sp. SID8352]|uniref:hypothetical protein n=1 Tax=Streptomyces sp. SID8352 TaxID=2690338 RepID=UPI0013681595|nr:hypothetical protein [Streptomyces sp. SID8352]MYU22863.1 hypothetical protein [Streptomyces sp. SID8352]
MPRSNARPQPHPLAAYADQIDPVTTYALRDVAALLGLSLSNVSGMALHGWLPGSRLRPHRRGGRTYTWTGKQLLRIAARPIRVEYDHDRYGPATLYRVGCRCPVCMRAHTAESRERKRALSEEAFPAETRAEVITLVAAGTPIADAAAEAGVSLAKVYGRATWDLAFGDQLDEAAWSLCVLGENAPGCGSPAGYRGKPKGRATRPACRGTGCREWRRAQAQAERSAAEE